MSVSAVSAEDMHTRIVSWAPLWSSDSMYIPMAVAGGVFCFLSAVMLPCFVVFYVSARWCYAEDDLI